jgi:hypothetical protein
LNRQFGWWRNEMKNDPHGPYWAAIAEASERIGSSEQCTSDDAAALCEAIDKLATVLMGELPERPRVPRKPDFWGFIHEDECRIEMCFSPEGPGPGGRFAVPLWTLAQPLDEDEAAARRMKPNGPAQAPAACGRSLAAGC